MADFPHMKRYLLFAGDQYYPAGGMHDLVGDFDAIADAVLALRGEWAHVFDTETNMIVRVWTRGVGLNGWHSPATFEPFVPGSANDG